MAKGVIILGSARSDGDTALVVDNLKKLTGFEVVDLKEKQIRHFDYAFKNQDDDFNELFKEIVTSYEILVFAALVYWYTMSGMIKVFFDRISDFLRYEKEYGRLLRGKTMTVLSCSNSDDVDKEFEIPFRKSAAYLGMEYAGHRHAVVDEGIINAKSKELLSELNDILSRKN